MKTRSILFPVVLLAAAFSFTSCDDTVNKLTSMVMDKSIVYEREDTEKWGEVIDRDLDLPAFSAIDASGAVAIVFAQDSICSVRAHGNEKCLDAYRFEVRKNELEVKLKKGADRINRNTPGVILYVTAPSLTDVETAGGCKIEMQGNIEMPGKMDIEMAGAGILDVDTLSVGDLDLTANGAVRCNIAKLTAKNDVEIEVNGAGEFNANLFCNELNVEFNGAASGVISGECNNYNCENNGACKIDFSNMKTK